LLGHRRAFLRRVVGGQRKGERKKTKIPSPEKGGCPRCQERRSRSEVFRKGLKMSHYGPKKHVAYSFEGVTKKKGKSRGDYKNP